MEIDAKVVAALRAETGAGMMECKKALLESGGDKEKAKEWLRKRGLDVAAKKSGRATNNGWIGSYLHHNGRVGVLVELLCETDFVAKGEVFQTLLKDIAMQVAMTNPIALSREQVPEAVLAKEREIYRAQVPPGKPPQIADRIVEGKVESFFKERCLLEQPFIKEAKITIKERISQAVQQTGENISMGRFSRFELGEKSA
ncbi:MAG: elongation factor Ts [Planctomycetes bacterium]|nr:elongation factor Ts [Planctomycetota bacterium]